MRIRPQDVLNILEFVPSTKNLTPFIEAAESLVTELCAPVAAYDAARLRLIETWLAAHFVAVRDDQYVASESLGDESVTYARQVMANLGGTLYGQNAMLLDTNGTLAYQDKHVVQGRRAKVNIVWLGTCRRFADQCRIV